MNQWWRREGIGRRPLSAAKRNGDAGSSGLRIIEAAASASSRWRVWVEKEPSKELGIGEVLRMGKGRARQGQARILLPRFNWANQRRESAAGQDKQGPPLQWSGDDVGTGRCAFLVRRQKTARSPLASQSVSRQSVLSLKAASTARGC
jgi:hypothetical protein